MSDNELLFQNEAKERARQAFVAGYHKRVGEEELGPMAEKAANSMFERWYDAQFE